MKNRLAPRMPLASLRTFEEPSADKSNEQQKLVIPEQATSTVVGIEKSDMEEKVAISMIQISLIDRSPHQPRLIFNPEAIDALASSISEIGLTSPISVRLMATGRYELIGGERRVRAHQILGKETIATYVLSEMTNTDAALGALADNEAKAGLCDYERGKAYRHALSLPVEEGRTKINQGILARRIGVSDATVSRCLAFFDLPTKAIEMLDEKPDLLGAKNAAILVGLAKKGHEEIVIQAMKRIKDDGASEQGAINWATSQVNQLSIPRKESHPFTLDGQHIADIVTDGTKVVITCKKGVNPEVLVERIKSLSKPA